MTEDESVKPPRTRECFGKMSFSFLFDIPSQILLCIITFGLVGWGHVWGRGMCGGGAWSKGQRAEVLSGAFNNWFKKKWGWERKLVSRQRRKPSRWSARAAKEKCWGAKRRLYALIISRLVINEAALMMTSEPRALNTKGLRNYLDSFFFPSASETELKREHVCLSSGFWFVRRCWLFSCSSEKNSSSVVNKNQNNMAAQWAELQGRYSCYRCFRIPSWWSVILHLASSPAFWDDDVRIRSHTVTSSRPQGAWLTSFITMV